MGPKGLGYARPKNSVTHDGLPYNELDCYTFLKIRFLLKINLFLLKNSHGMYLLAEGHGNEKLSTFRLMTPTVDLTTSSDFCLSFWYLMYGRHTFSLSVELMVPRFRTTSQRLFSVSGPLSKSRTDWLYAQVMIKPNYSDDQMEMFYAKAKIKFEAKRGWSYLSDIAIDDLMLRPTECQKIPVAGTTASPDQLAAMATWSPPVVSTVTTTTTTTEPFDKNVLELLSYRPNRLMEPAINSGTYSGWQNIEIIIV